jgi:hypothetical protein
MITYTIDGLILTAPPSLSITLRLNASVMSYGRTGATNVGVGVLAACYQFVNLDNSGSIWIDRCDISS